MFWLKKWLGGLLMPLPFTLMLIVLGLLLLWFTRRQRLGKSLCTLGTLLLITLSLRPVSVELLRPLQCDPMQARRLRAGKPGKRRG